MYTQCPECNTIFRVQEPQLEKAAGRVRCGQCMAVFDAHEQKVDELPAGADQSGTDASAQPTESPEVDAAGQAPTGAESSGTSDEDGEDFDIEALLSTPYDQPEEEDTWPEDAEGGGGSESYELAEEEDDSLDVLDFDFGESDDEEDKTAAAPPSDALTMDLDEGEEHSAEPQMPEMGPSTTAQEEVPRAEDEDEDEDSVEEPKKSRGFLGTLVWAVLVLLLTGGLLAQYAYYNHQALAWQEVLRPWIERLCETVPCEMTQRRDPEAIELADRRVQSHPRFRDALLITATLVNDGDFVQPYPIVEVSLKDVHGRPVASRRFGPVEYLVDEDSDRFLPGQEAHLRLEVADPGEEAVSFEFDFH